MTQDSEEEDVARRNRDARRYPTRWEKLTWWGTTFVLANQLVDLSDTLIRLMYR